VLVIQKVKGVFGRFLVLASKSCLFIVLILGVAG
jgi:hypothetical protein